MKFIKKTEVSGMYKKSVLFLIAETPVHAGSGSEVGVVDLPIQRERYTEFPKIESSGLKGCIREAFERVNMGVKINGRTVRPKDEVRYKRDGQEKRTDYVSLLFGPEGEESHAGAVVITDARILLFPVKSLRGVFGWITCPMVIERFKKDLEIVGIGGFNFSPRENTVPISSGVVISDKGEKKVVLEEFTFEVKEDEEAKKLAEWLAEKIFSGGGSYEFWKNKLAKDLVILSDDSFGEFVKTSTEVITRVKIDDVTGTVEEGALWTEEYLPQDTIMYSIVMFSQLRVDVDEQKGVLGASVPDDEARLVSEFFEKALPKVIHIGGNQTTGKGLMRVKLLK